MVVAPKYQGIEIPLHGPEVDVPGFLDFPTAIREHEGPTFIRPIGIYFMGIESGSAQERSIAKLGLSKILDMTDTELQEVAGLCEASIVGHQWGLHKVPEKKQEILSRYNPHPVPLLSRLLPEGHIVVAEVDVIKGSTRLPSNIREKIRLGNQRYRTKATNQPKLFDTRERQFMVEYLEDADEYNDQNRKTWLVDIEPRFL
ncbi:MAG TPA: hypothetical protein VD947_00100 [Patescibacteria group bacterium]|nr:hypothetical protein [Patescibacteria group bacterium]